jgi:hypothetical protein
MMPVHNVQTPSMTSHYWFVGLDAIVSFSGITGNGLGISKMELRVGLTYVILGSV